MPENRYRAASVEDLFAIFDDAPKIDAPQERVDLDGLFASLDAPARRASDDEKARAPKTARIATIDFETDPGEPPIVDHDGRVVVPGRIIKPFAWGFFDGTLYASASGDDCVEKLIDHLMRLSEPHFIYAHNGGNFDFLFLLPYLEKDMMIINGRIVECRLGRHRLRDSYAIIPVALKAFGDKREIDIEKLHVTRRHKHMPEIMDYLRQDCVGLWKGVTEYETRFGLSLTMASTALGRLEQTYGKKGEKIKRLSRAQDGELRSYYYGGRVECFRKGILQEPLKYYDVNSMYPYVMAGVDHPVGNVFIEQTEIDEKTDFAEIDAESKGALPVRTKDGLLFAHGRGTFRATGHEIRAGIETGTLTVHRVISAISAVERDNFADFVRPLYDMRLAAKERGDPIDTLFLKLLLNSAYGKLALNPRTFQEHQITRIDAEDMPREDDGWSAIAMTDSYIVWARSIDEIAPEKINRKFVNVATAASITGAARAHLARAIARAERVAYCDTDSVLAEAIDMPCDPNALGSWKVEAEADEAAIAAKKIYALFRDGGCIKLASKGVRLTAEDIRKVAMGGSVTWQSPVPKIKLTGHQIYTRREISLAR